MSGLEGRPLCCKTMILFGWLIFLNAVNGQLSEPLSLVFEGKTEFLLFTKSVVFDDALAECGNFDSSATLARVDTLEEFNFIISALDFDTLSILSEFSFYRFWVGLRDIRDNTLPTKQFTYIDGVQSNISFVEEPGVLPWASNRPSASRQNPVCGQWVARVKDPIVHKRWIDNTCPFLKDGFLCRREFVKPQIQPLSVVFNDTTEFLYFDQAANFEVASKACSDFDPDSTLARIDNEEEFDFILKALDFKSLNDENGTSFGIWTGLNNQDGLRNGSFTSSFSYLDGVQNNISFFERSSQKPWNVSQPSAVRTIEQCVSWETNEEFGQFWRVQECNALLPGFLCRREAQKFDEEPFSFIFEDKAQFLFFNQSFNFEIASKACKSYNSKASLARIDNEAEFDFLAGTFANVSFPLDGSNTFSTWIGFKEDKNVSSQDSTDRFVSIDLAQTNSSFFEAPFQKPWDITQPSNTPGIQDCVSWELAEDQSFSWFANDCRDIKSSYLCRIDLEEVDNAIEDESSNALFYILLAVIWLLWLMVITLCIRTIRSQPRSK